MSTAARWARAHRHVLQTCATPSESRALRIEVVRQLQHAVGFEAYAWLVTDPETSVGTSPVADVPWLGELPEQIRLKYQTPLHRWTQLTSPVARLDAATSGDLAASLVWRELLSRHGVTDAASVVFRDRFGCWAFLELWRTHGSPPFTEAEAAFLAGVAAPLTTALRRSQSRTFTQRPLRESAPGPVVLILSPQLHVRAQTPSAQAYLHDLVPPDEGAAPVPAIAYNVAAQLLAVEAGTDGNPPSGRVHVGQGAWVTARAARIGAAHAGADRDIAVTVERATPAERAGVFARAFGLTRREAELLRHLVAGSDSRELAARLSVSANTVQDHLKSIFAKTGFHSRRELLAHVFGAARDQEAGGAQGAGSST